MLRILSEGLVNRTWIGARALAAAISAAPAPAAAVDMGLTPNEAYGLCANINQALLAVPHYTSGGKVLSSRVAGTKAREFGEKKPVDVFDYVINFTRKLCRLRRSGYLGEIIFVEERKLAKRITTWGSAGHLGEIVFVESRGEKITPTDVFLNSGLVLDGVVEWIAKNSPSKHLINPLYGYETYRNKKPGDVYSLVDLAHRRIDLILPDVEQPGFYPRDKRNA
jgi:hypothetical protein